MPEAFRTDFAREREDARRYADRESRNADSGKHPPPRTLPAAAVPKYLRTAHVLTGYRNVQRTEGSWKRTWATLWQWNNETLDVWTHLLPSPIYLLLAAYWAFRAPASTTTTTTLASPRAWSTADRWSMVAYAAAAATCFGVSATYHLLQVYSWRVFRRMRLADFQGIVLLIAASYVPALRLGYRCWPRVAHILLRTNAVLYAVTAAAMWRAHCTDARLFRNICFVVYTAWGWVPLWLGACLRIPFVGWLTRQAAVLWTIYGVGFWFHCSGWPERQWRGRFDNCGHSHQWFHVATVVASAFWVHAMIALHHRAYADGCSAA